MPRWFLAIVRNDDGKYDAPAPAEQRAKDDTQQLDRILRCHLPDLPWMQRQIILETFIDERKRAEVALRLGISVNTYDVHLQAALRSLRAQLAHVVELFTDVDRPLWYDFIEELSERHEASRLRRASAKKGKRSTLKSDRSNFGGDRSNSERDRGNNSRAGAA
ncbi:MAG TPA: sigma factor-like helix-turn-helix DNA-binding protein [Gemmatimonadaceae bacterium]